MSWFYNPINLYVTKTILSFGYGFYLLLTTVDLAFNCGLWWYQLIRFFQKLPIVLLAVYPKEIKSLELYPSFVLVISMFLNIILMANKEGLEISCPTNMIFFTNIEHYFFLVVFVCVLFLYISMRIHYSFKRRDNY